jgi:hypothetical protein
MALALGAGGMRLFAPDANKLAAQITESMKIRTTPRIGNRGND